MDNIKTYSLEDLVSLYFTLLPSQLISEVGKHAIKHIASFFPALSGIGLEYHFNSKEPRTDFLIRITQKEINFKHLYLQDYLSRLGEQSEDIAFWKSQAAFIESWKHSSPDVLQGVENLWYEFDLKDGNRDITNPSLFFDFDRGNLYKPAVKLDHLEKILTLCFKTEIHSYTTFLISLIEDRQVQLYYVGLMLSREKSPVRICMLFNDPFYLLQFLRNKNLDENFTTALAVLTKIISFTTRIVLDIDLTGQVNESMGVECFFDHRHNLEACMKELTALGMVSPNELDAFLLCEKTIPGVTTAFQQFSTISARINHIKLSLNKDSICSVKGYIYLSY